MFISEHMLLLFNLIASDLDVSTSNILKHAFTVEATLPKQI